MESNKIESVFHVKYLKDNVYVEVIDNTVEISLYIDKKWNELKNLDFETITKLITNLSTMLIEIKEDKELEKFKRENQNEK